MKGQCRASLLERVFRLRCVSYLDAAGLAAQAHARCKLQPMSAITHIAAEKNIMGGHRVPHDDLEQSCTTCLMSESYVHIVHVAKKF